MSPFPPFLRRAASGAAWLLLVQSPLAAVPALPTHQEAAQLLQMQR